MKRLTVLITALLFAASVIQAQTRQSRVGLLWKSIDAKGVWSSGTYVWQNRETEWPVGGLQDWTAPDGTTIMGYLSDAIAEPHQNNSWGEGYWIGLKDWTSPASWVNDGIHDPAIHYDVFVTKYGPDNPNTKVHIPVNNSLKRLLRQNPPEVWADENKVLPTSTEPGSWDEVDPDLISDELLEVAWNLSVGLSCEKKVYSYANRDHDDYAIIDLTVTNSGIWDANTGKSFTPDTLHDFWWGIVVKVWGDVQKKGFSPLDKAGGDPLYDYDPDNRIMYSWDGDDPAQGTGWDQWELHPGEGEYQVEFIAPTFTGIGIIHADKAYNDPTDWTSQPASIITPKQMVVGDDAELYDSLSCSYHFKSDITKIPGAREVIIGFGPYELPPNEDLRFVYAWACGARSQRECIEIGWKYKKGEVTQNEVDDFMWAGRDSLFMNIDNAKWAFSNGYDIPDPLPAPNNMKAEKGFGENIVSWDPVPGAVEYRLYQATGLIRPQEPSYNGIYKEVYRGTETYIHDTKVSPGFSYFYYVTALDQNGLESNIHYNRLTTKFGRIPEIPGLAEVNKVRVVPNPYNIKGGEYNPDNPHGTTGFNYKGDTNTLQFVNLPKAACTIKVYTMKGDLIKTFEKPEGPDRIRWENMLTRWNQFIVSGVYFFVVDAPGVGIYKDKFVVVR
jgi:hypothetical protein